MIYFTFLWIIVTLVIQTQEFNPKHVHHSNEKKLIAYKDEEKKECQIRFNNYGKEEQFVALNLKYNFGNKKTLSRKEIINIIDEDMIKFCENYKITFVNLNDKKKFRSKRASDKKRYQGQTQTQFVSFGPQYSNNQSVKNGIAEAVSQPDMSKATVSGVNFMGQAQSQSSVTDCDDCKEQNIEKNHNSIKHYTSPHSLTDFNGRKYKENILNFPPNVPSNNNKPIQLTQENQNNFKKHLMTNNENRLPSYYLNAGKNIQEVSLPKPVENNADFSYGNIPNDNAAPNNNDFSTYKNNLNPTYNKQPFDYFNENRLQLLNNYSNEHSSPNQMNINQKPLINYEQSNSKDKTLNPNSPYNFKQQLVSNNNPLNLPQSRYFLNTNPPYTNPTQSHSKVITNQQNQKPLSDDINYAQKPFFYSAYSNIRHPLLNQNLNQFNLPTLCSYIYQTCLNAISNIRDQAGLSYHQFPLNYQGTKQHDNSMLTQNFYPESGQILTENNGFRRQKFMYTQPNYADSIQNLIGYNPSNEYIRQHPIQPSYLGLVQVPIRNNEPSNQQPINTQLSYPGYSQSPINNNGLFGQQPTNTQSSFSNLGQSSVGDNVPHNQQPTSTQFSYPGTGQTPINNNNGLFGQQTTNAQSSYPGYSQSPINNNGLFGQQSTNTTQPNYPGTGQTPINNNNGLFGQQPTNAQSSYPGYSQSPINNNGLFGQQPTNTQSSFSDLGQSSVGDNVPHNQQPTSSQFSYPGASQTSINNNNPFDEHPTNTQSSYSKLGQSSIGNNAPSISQLAYASPNYSRSDQSFNDKNTSTGPQFQVSSPIPINIQQLDSELPNKLTHTTNYAITGGKIGSDVSIGNLMTPIDTEGGDSQSLTSLNIDGKETSALASAQGKSTSGITQTQVSGSYSGTGTFSAQAQTSDSDKGAQSLIVGNSNGTTSSAEGKGGKSKVQSQMHYNYETGTALGEAQSSGINYTTNTQLEVGVKGGIADAQSSGPGSTSSQAQIGFLPHDLNNNTDQKSLFKGGGTASAQGGTYTGQSQSQLFGSYKHGISYNGAAQASSGKNYQNLPKLTIGNSKNTINKLEKIGNNSRDDIQLHKSFQMLEENQTSTQKIKILDNVMNTTQNSIIYSTSTSSPIYSSSESSQNFDVDSEYNYDDEYYEDEKEDQIYSKTELNAKENIPTQAQNSFLNLGDKHDIKIIRDTDKTMKNSQVLSSGEIIPGTNGTKVPIGLRARVTSVAGDQTEAKAFPGGQAQSQTIHYTPGSGGLTIVDKTKLRALLGNESYITPLNKTYKHFQTDTNGETGFYQSSDKNIQYYTKSSTCGYFSFSCNYIDGAKTGAKICKPNALPFPCQNKILVR